MSTPNVLLLLTDQQQASTIAPESPCSTPNVDRLAAEGTRFSRCYASNPICSPSRASLLTGVLPHEHGMVDCTHTVPPYRARFRTSLPTWSESLADAGYYLGYVGKWHIERSRRLETFGFDEYTVGWTGEFDEGYREHRCNLGLEPELDRSPAALNDAGVVGQPGYRDLTLYGTHDDPPAGTREYYTYTLGEEFVRERENEDNPWCLTVSTYGPHDPYVIPREYAAQYDPNELEKPANVHDSMADKPELYRRQRTVWDDLQWEDIATARAHYFAYCSLIDDQVGQLLDTLEKTGQLDDTVVIYASDHGDFLGAHRLFTKGAPPFEEAYRVPLVVRRPGDKLRVCDDIVQLHDLAPTLADLGGGEMRPGAARTPICNEMAVRVKGTFEYEGERSFRACSLVPFLDGSRPSGYRDEAYAEFHGQRFGWTQRVVWDDRYKYVFNGFGHDELYDLRENPHELLNRIDDPDHEAHAARLARRMWEIARDTNDYSLFMAQDAMYRFAPVGPKS